MLPRSVWPSKKSTWPTPGLLVPSWLVTTAVKVTGTLPSAERADVVSVVLVANSETNVPSPTPFSMTAFEASERTTSKDLASAEGAMRRSGR